MRTIDDYLESLVLGSFAFISIIYSIYILSPNFVLPFLQWALADLARMTPLIPAIFILGLISHRVALTFNNALLHKPLLKKQSENFKNIVGVANRFRQIPDQSIGRTLEWGWYLMLQIGSDEMKKQNLRIFYAYRISYGSFFLLLFPLFSAITGLFIPQVDKDLCLYTIIGSVVLLIGAYISAVSNVKNYWRNIYYSTQVLLETQADLFSATLIQKNSKNKSGSNRQADSALKNE